MTAVKWMPKKNISNSVIHKAYIYQDQPSTQTEYVFHAQYLKTISQSTHILIF
jgi:hypothetical protein